MTTHREHPVDGANDGRPQMIDETAIPGAQPVVPHAGGHVRAHVGVEFGFLDKTTRKVVVEPPAVAVLRVGEPFVGALGLAMEAGHVEGHGRLDVVPRVAVSAFEPRDHAGVELQRGDRFGGADDLVGTQHTFDVRHVRHAATCIPDFVDVFAPGFLVP